MASRAYICGDCGGEFFTAEGARGPRPHRCPTCKGLHVLGLYARHHGTDSADFTERIEAQRGRCAECGEKFEYSYRHPRLPRLDHRDSCCKYRNSCGVCLTRVICRTCNLPHDRRRREAERKDGVTK